MRSVVEMLEQSVRKFGERPALWEPAEDGSYSKRTYGHFFQDVKAVAGQLDAAGVRAGDRVGLLAENRSYWPISDFAIMSLGACTVPIYPSLPANQIEYILEHSGMTGIFVQDMKQLAKLLDVPGEHTRALKFVVVLADDSENVLLRKARERFHTHAFSAWVAADPLLDDAAWRGRWAAIDRETTATVVYTSGTTGIPKGVVLSHGNLLANLEGIKEIVKLTPEDQSLSYLPLSHIFERTAGQLVPLEAGAAIAYSRGFRFMVEDFQKMPPTIVTTVPRLLEKIQEAVQEQMTHASGLRRGIFKAAVRHATQARVLKTHRGGWRLALYDKLVFRKIRNAFGGRVRTVIVGGAPMPRYVGVFFTAAGMSIAEGYGMTETSPVVCVNYPEAPRLGTAGKILSNVKVQIADDGEVLVKGPSIMKSYFHNDEATKETFTEDGWLKTGDIGHILPDGYLQITDRKKHLIVLSTGKKVTPAPIENDILKNPAIEQVLLIGQSEKYVSAIVVPNESYVREWYEKQGVSCPPFVDWGRDNSLVKFLLGVVQHATAYYARFEQPKKVLVAREPFTIENNLLTPTLKVRGKNVLQAYREDIEGLYADAGGIGDQVS